MSRSKGKSRARGFALPEELVARRVAFAASGASGTHEDQKSRVHRTGDTNRVGSRSARTRAAIRNDGW
ncbi:hypothetical protein KRR55_11685 [Paeniglutamicibacter sp. ABSL32-1]|uniref:hypothetical protein n=1 Tax=Paeniglutamicibacter quisquiliarum TaxID=2849498 RepID=UPI001C2CCEA0|nr:hypothetical protein [Paeniglutamicibacter quisquiliarum]MBV1779772.1 hypothetical protein [Paeniglutamicibacter quisquiliarum]